MFIVEFLFVFNIQQTLLKLKQYNLKSILCQKTLNYLLFFQLNSAETLSLKRESTELLGIDIKDVFNFGQHIKLPDFNVLNKLLYN